MAPDIIESLLAGSAPPDLTLAKVLKTVPLDWDQQHREFGVSTISTVANSSAGGCW
jgi:hypothetical protein